MNYKLCEHLPNPDYSKTDEPFPILLCVHSLTEMLDEHLPRMAGSTKAFLSHVICCCV